MEILYRDDRIVVCVKPAGVKSTDELGGVPQLIRLALNDPNATVRTVHRLDQAVSGLMVLARTARAAADLSAQMRSGAFHKEYLAIVHGTPESTGVLNDLLYRDKRRKMTLVVTAPGKNVQEASLDYRLLSSSAGMSRVHICLHTGRTHQIRVQFSSRGYPLVGEKKYHQDPGNTPIALWSYRLSFRHPRTGEQMEFVKDPPAVYPWTCV